jgi:hypothetical protein
MPLKRPNHADGTPFTDAEFADYKKAKQRAYDQRKRDGTAVKREKWASEEERQRVLAERKRI